MPELIVRDRRVRGLVVDVGGVEPGIALTCALLGGLCESAPAHVIAYGGLKAVSTGALISVLAVLLGTMAACGKWRAASASFVLTFFAMAASAIVPHAFFGRVVSGTPVFLVLASILACSASVVPGWLLVWALGRMVCRPTRRELVMIVAAGWTVAESVDTSSFHALASTLQHMLHAAGPTMQVDASGFMLGQFLYKALWLIPGLALVPRIADMLGGSSASAPPSPPSAPTSGCPASPTTPPLKRCGAGAEIPPVQLNIFLNGGRVIRRVDRLVIRCRSGKSYNRFWQARRGSGPRGTRSVAKYPRPSQGRSTGVKGVLR